MANICVPEQLTQLKSRLLSFKTAQCLKTWNVRKLNVIQKFLRSKVVSGEVIICRSNSSLVYIFTDSHLNSYGNQGYL